MNLPDLRADTGQPLEPHTVTVQRVKLGLDRSVLSRLMLRLQLHEPLHVEVRLVTRPRRDHERVQVRPVSADRPDQPAFLPVAIYGFEVTG